MNEDVHWKQRFSNYKMALTQLTKFIDRSELIELEKQGLIQAFKYTHELAWNLLKDYLQDQGIQNITGSKDSVQFAFKMGLIEDGESWMEMIKDRNQTVHTYNEATAEAIIRNIRTRFFTLFIALGQKMQELSDETE